MAPQRHRYTKCILLTGQRANKSNERVVCKFCSEAESPQWALQHSLLCNTKKLVKSHLRRCRHFQAAQESCSAAERIVFTEDEAASDDDDDAAAAAARGPGSSRASRKRKPMMLVLDGVVPPTSAGAGVAAPSSAKKIKAETPGGGRQSRAVAAPSVAAETVERLLLDATLANGWAFSWVDSHASRAMLQGLTPGVFVPTSERLETDVLQAAGDKEAACVWSAVGAERLGCTLVLDAWRHVERSRSLGVVLTTSQGDALVWTTEPVNEPAERGDVLDVVDALLAQSSASRVPAVALVAGSSRCYATTRRHLRAARRDLMVLPCLVEQVQSVASHAVQHTPFWREALVRAMTLVLVLQSHASPLLTSHREALGLGLRTLTLPAKKPLDWALVRELTADALSWKTVLASDAGAAAEAAVLANVDLDANDEDVFWAPLAALDRLLGRMTRWLEVLRQEPVRLHVVPLLLQSLVSSPDVTPSVEAAWQHWEHPLLVLAVVLNPACGWSAVHAASGVTLMRLGLWARYYFQSFFGEQPKDLVNELLEYVEGAKFWCAPTSIASFASSFQNPSALPSAGEPDLELHELVRKATFKVVPYWKSCSAECPELSRLALRVFSVVFTPASTAGLFRDVVLDSAVASSASYHLAALRVRARSILAAAQSPPVAASSSRMPVVPGSSPRAAVESCVDELLNRWSDPEAGAAKNDDDDTENENESESEISGSKDEAINSLYAHVHPADDRHSKYTLLALFPTVVSVV
ncbi:hypothetical protein P43SY_006425 [Pythium insidiosum]|uniref:Uncharacterized protein n=1 Tax=Pythium insidiosum TaxID=114742 RepID=A0AAD5LRZ8_PYTIN|nr:hypothetical protein P43SY_006425 [Pythium insidiosum]